MKRPRSSAATPRRRPAPRRRNPEGVVSRIYYDRLAEKEFRVTEDELNGHLYMAEEANGIAKALDGFTRDHGASARLLTAEEWDALSTARRILSSLAISRATFHVVERRGPPKNYPGSRR